MNKTAESLAHVLREFSAIYESSILVAEVRFILQGADMTHIQCRIWFDLAQQQYRYDLSHELPGMAASGTVWGDTPQSALRLALERLDEYGEYNAGTKLVENPFFSDPNAE